MHPRCGDTPFVALTASLVFGITVSRTIHVYWFWAFSLAGGAVLAAAAVAWLRRRDTLAWALSLSAIALAGLLLALAHRDAFAANDLRALISRSLLPLGEMALVDGCVAENPQQRGEEILATLDLHGYMRTSRWNTCQGRVLLRMPAPEAGSPICRSGDRLRGWAELTVPRNFQNAGSPDRAEALRRRGVFLLGKVRSTRLLEVLPGDCASAWAKFVASGRDRLSRRLLRLNAEGHRQEAAVLLSILVGDYTGLDSRTREIFQNSGTYHVLVVSGLHVAWIAGVLLGAFRYLHVPEAVGRGLVASTILFYGCIVGLEASISRCLWMFGVYLLGKTLFRKAQPLNIVLVSGFLLLAVRPDWLFDAGFQLSFLSVVSIFVTALPLIESAKPLFEPLHSDPGVLSLDPGRISRFGRRLRFQVELFSEAVADRFGTWPGRILTAISRCLGRCSSALTGMLLISCSIQIWLEPLLAYHFNRLSWIAPLANLVVVPTSSAVLAAGMLAALLPQSLFPDLILTRFAALSASLLLKITAATAAIPGAWQRCATLPAGIVAAGILTLFISHLLRRRIWIPWVLLSALLAFTATNPVQAIALWRGQKACVSSGGKLRITFLDVGEGDALVLQFPDSRTWVLDAGGIYQIEEENEISVTFDLGEAVVSRFLWHHWITRLDRIVVSHPDLDHAGGVPALLKNFHVSRLDHAGKLDEPPFPPLTIHRAEAGELYEICGVRIQVLNPPDSAAGRTTNENSIVLRLEFGRFSALLTGDLEGAGEAAVLSRHDDLHSLLLKVSHHGSRNGTKEGFLRRVRPQWGVISVGKNNPFGHPSAEVVTRLLRAGVRYFLTTDQGAIAFETDGASYRIESRVGGLIDSGLLP
jgi:competence protein ComEC